MSETLRPCPFCGVDVKCHQAVVIHPAGICGLGNARMARDYWNRRASDAAWLAAEEIEKEMRAEADHIDLLQTEYIGEYLRTLVSRLAAARKGAKG